jgi:hypothetical protein
MSVNMPDDYEYTNWINAGSGKYVAFVGQNDPIYGDTTTVDVFATRQDFTAPCSTRDDPPLIVPRFDISGSTTLTINVLGVDVTTPTDTVPAGQSVRATAAPINFPAGGQVQWVFDTAQYKPQVTIPACANMLICDYSPSRAGAIMACIYESYGTPVCGSHRIWVGQAVGITLVCPGVVARGSDQTCSATPTNGVGTLVVTAWSFTSATGIQVDRTQNVSASTWSGKIVTSGTVTVRGTVNRSVQQASVPLLVSSRNWVGKKTLKDHMVIATTFTSKPTRMADLGNTEISLNPDANVARWLGVISDDGPNQNFLYMLDLPPITKTVSQVNTRAISDTSSFYRVQESKRKKIGTLWYCAKSVVTSTLPGLVTKHEGAVPDPDIYPNSHPAIFRAHVDAYAPQRFEPLVGYDGADVVTPVRNALFDEASIDSQAMDSDQRNYINSQTLGCDTFHFIYP